MSYNPFSTLAPKPPSIIDLTVENQDIEITKPQPSPVKIKNLSKTKKKVSFPSVISADNT